MSKKYYLSYLLQKYSNTEDTANFVKNRYFHNIFDFILILQQLCNGIPIQQNLKNIMQVRKSLQNQKSHRNKNNTNPPLLLHPKQKQTIKVLRTERSKSKSKSNSEKENAKRKILTKKSKQKISPIKIKKKQEILNTSPIIYTERIQRKKSVKSKSPMKQKQTNNKMGNNPKDFQKIGGHSISTKLNTERTPVKRYKEQAIKTKLTTTNKKSKKSKSTNKKQKVKKKNTQQHNSKAQMQQNSQKLYQSQQNYYKAFKKSKKLPPQINTIGPQRKQSYFDKQILQKLNLDKSQFLRRKRNKQKQPYTQPQIQQKQQNIIAQQTQTNTNTYIHNYTHNYTHNNTYNEIKNNATMSINSYKEYGTITQQNMIDPPISYRDIQSFRKQQQLKWKIVYLQLSNLKNNLTTPQKISQIIQQSHKNITQFQTKCKQISNSHIINHYIIQSPTKIRNALTNRYRKSSEENKEIIKNLSDQKLLQQLQNLQLSQFKINSNSNFNSNSNLIEQRVGQSSNSFCIQFQKQMQKYTQQNQQKLNIKDNKKKQISFVNLNTNTNANNNQNTNININQFLQNIPQLQFQKSMQVYKQIQQRLLLQYCSQLVQKQFIFHRFLITVNKNSINIQQQQKQQKQNQYQYSFSQYKIKCKPQYSLDLLTRLFTYIQKQNKTQQILSRANIPFGNSPILNLKYLRSYFSQNSQQLQQLQQQQNNRVIQPILDSQMLGQFELQNNQIPIQGQYFYNHAIYSCINQILDTIRPYGQAGLPPLQSQDNIVVRHTNINKVYRTIYNILGQYLQLKIGRTQFIQQYIQPIKYVQKNYSKLDKYLIREEQQKWKKVQDNQFEEKYFLSQAIIDQIFNEEILMLFNEYI